MTDPDRLAEPRTAYRIGDLRGRWPVYSADGARLVAGRWHEAGSRVIYASEHYSTAMLEALARWNGPPPGRQHFVTIQIPAGTSYEVVDDDALADWHLQDSPSARRFGRLWYEEKRSVILVVPSVVARPERNLVINAFHPEFPRLVPDEERPVWWDRRLFR